MVNAEKERKSNSMPNAKDSRHGGFDEAFKVFCRLKNEPLSVVVEL